MASIIKDLIEYSGIANIFPKNPKAFKHLTVQENLIIPVEKPNVQQILRVVVSAIICDTRIITTPVSTSQEGQILTGHKLLIEGELIQKIEYIADEATQSVHATDFKVTFSTFIVLPFDFNEGSVVNVIPYIEDIYVHQLDKRNIFRNIVLFLNAVIF